MTLAKTSRRGAVRANRQRNAVALGGSAYVGASNKRSLADWVAPFGNADSELLSLQTLRDRSRDLYRNAPAAAGAINKLVNGTIGKGLRLKSSIDRDFLKISEGQAQDWQEIAQQEFRIWAESKCCDYMRQSTFAALQRLAYKSQLTNGDTFVLLPHKERPMMPYDLRVQLIEADRICNPDDAADTDKIAAGIERDDCGVPVAIYIRTPHPGASLFSVDNIVAKWQRVPFYGRKTGRRHVLHLVDITRIGQTRGVPVLAPVIDTLKQISKYSEAELSAAVINAMLSVCVKRPAGDPLTGAGAAQYEDGQEPWNDPDNYKLGNGTWIDLAPGEDLEVVNAGRPSGQFDPFFLACMKQIGMALGIPFEVLINHFSSSYSASRAALLEFYENVIVLREEFADAFCQPIYNEFLLEAVLKGRIIAPGFLINPSIQFAYSGAYWVGAGIKQLDEVKEVDAAVRRIRGNLSTAQHEASKLTGLDYKDIIRQRAEEKRIAAEYGLSAEYDVAYNTTNSGAINTKNEEKEDDNE